MFKLNKWTTKEGEEIYLEDLKDNHLLNIIKLIDKRAKDGMVIEIAGCGPGDNMDVYVDYETVYGEDVYDEIPIYKELILERNKRGLK